MRPRDRWKELLRQRGLRATGPRLAVLEALEAAGRPLAHSELVERLTEADLDPATVYRNLVKLTEAGLAQVVSRAGGMARYERSIEEAGEHAHFVCVDCGTVSCLPEATLPRPALEGPWAESLQHARLELEGSCPDCREA